VLAAALTEEVPAPRHAGSLARVLYGLLAREPAQRMTAEAAMPLLIDVANERAAPPVADATMLDQPVTPRPGALETVLDSSAIEGALRDHPATMQGFEQPAAFRQEHPRTEIARDPAPQEHPRTQVSPEQAAREQIPWAEAQRGQHEERTEIQPSWQPPAPDPWQRPPGTAHQTPYGAPQPYEPRQPVYETPQSAYESYQQSQQSQQPQYAQQQHAQPEYTQAQYQQPHPARRTRLVVLVLVAALVVAASLILGAIILRNMSSASGPPAPSGSASAAAAAASPAGYEKKQESGFSVAVPAGWSRDESAQGVFFRAPDGTTALQIGQTPWTVTTAGEQAASCDVSFAGRTKVFPGYSRKSINDAIPYQGTQASDLEFTYTDTQGRTVHAVDRFVRINGRPYAIYFRCLDGNWTAYQRTLAAIDNSFRAG
jgi:hypothetical protein